MIKYQVWLEPEDDLFNVYFPDIPNLATFGSSKDEALFMAKDVLSLYLEEARDPEWQIPVPKNRKSKKYHWITPYSSVTIPLLIRKKRLEAGLSQNKMAKMLGMTTQQLQKLETPGKSNPTVKTLEKISKVLKADLLIDLVA